MRPSHLPAHAFSPRASAVLTQLRPVGPLEAIFGASAQPGGRLFLPQYLELLASDLRLVPEDATAPAGELP